VLFRCRYLNLDWHFLCETCLLSIKSSYPDSYVYGGTWKSAKK